MHYDSILKTLKYAVAHKVTMYHTGRMYVFSDHAYSYVSAKVGNG